MEQQLFLGNTMVCRVSWRRIHLMLGSYTAITTCFKSADVTSGIKYVYMYITLATLWKFLHYTPKRPEDCYAVRYLLAGTWTLVKAVKASCSAIVNALNNIYEQTHEPEALGISRALCKPSTVHMSEMYLLDYVLPQVAELNRAFQAERIDLTAITTLVDATLNTLDNNRCLLNFSVAQ